MDIYEEMLLQIVEVLKKHNKPLPDLTHKEAIEEIRSIVTGNTTHAEKITKEDIANNSDSKDYYSLEQDLPDIDLTVEFKDNPHKCGNCKYLIFKDHEHKDGTCRVTRLHRRFTDLCVHTI